MKQKKGIDSTSKTIPSRSFNYVYFQHTPLKFPLVKSARFILHRKSFLRDLLRQGNNQNKGGKV